MMELPLLLTPSTTESFLVHGREVQVLKSTPVFPMWKGPTQCNTYGGKDHLNFEGKPAFAELVILWTLEAAGWEGAWIDTFGRRYLKGFCETPELAVLPKGMTSLLARIESSQGARSWDVFCMKAGVPLFVESKKRGEDHVRTSQRVFFEAALDLGLERSSFLLVEWTSVDLDKLGKS